MKAVDRILMVLVAAFVAVIGTAVVVGNAHAGGGILNLLWWVPGH